MNCISNPLENHQATGQTVAVIHQQHMRNIRVVAGKRHHPRYRRARLDDPFALGLWLAMRNGREFIDDAIARLINQVGIAPEDRIRRRRTPASRPLAANRRETRCRGVLLCSRCCRNGAYSCRQRVLVLRNGRVMNV